MRCRARWCGGSAGTCWRSARNRATEDRPRNTRKTRNVRTTLMMKLVKAHAYGNDFLLVDASQLPQSVDRSVVARTLCERHRGIGADGLIVWSRRSDVVGTRMDLLNADGSYSEVSGNGVRCLAASLAAAANAGPGETIAIETDAGTKTLELLEKDVRRFLFRAAMGQPEKVEKRVLRVGDAEVEAVTL